MRGRGQQGAAKQGVLAFQSWGGPRAGAGRKPKGGRALVSHGGREKLAKRFPVHVTMRLRSGLASLRTKHTRRVLESVLAAACDRFGTRIVHYSLQSNHVHLIVESEERRALSRALQGLAIRIARALNKLWGRTGKVFADRYHDRILRTRREVRNALVYVLKNHAHHGIGLVGMDPYASGRAFDGWEGMEGPCESSAHVARAKTWLLWIGWKYWGLVREEEVPGRRP